MNDTHVVQAYLLTGMPHVLLAHEQSPGWGALHRSFQNVRDEVASLDADLILYFSTQWFSVIGHLFQARQKPEWIHVDPEWHQLGSMPYRFEVDAEFAHVYAQQVKNDGYHVATVDYHGFPIDTGTVVVQKLINPDNRLPASMVSCNIYADKDEMMMLGQAATRALAQSGKKAVVVLVSSLSHRFEVEDIDPAQDRISSAKDHEWNLKICELLGMGRLEDVSQCAREFAREANADMGFKGIWWLNGLCGQHNYFKGHVFDYQPVWGTGAALIGMTPTKPIKPLAHLSLESESDVVQGIENADPSYRRVGKAAPGTREPLAPSTASVVSEGSAQPAPPSLSRIQSEQAPEPVGAYPHARREGDFLFLSGVGPRQKGTDDIPGVARGESGDVVSHDIRLQTRAVIGNVRRILADCGSSQDKIVDIQVYLTDMAGDFAAFNKVYAEELGAVGATRTTIGVTSLPTPIAVEFKVVARV